MHWLEKMLNELETWPMSRRAYDETRQGCCYEKKCIFGHFMTPTSFEIAVKKEQSGNSPGICDLVDYFPTLKLEVDGEIIALCEMSLPERTLASRLQGLHDMRSRWDSVGIAKNYIEDLRASIRNRLS